MRKLQRTMILACLVGLFPLAAWSIPLNRTEQNRRLYPLIDQLTDGLDAQQIDTLFEHRGETPERGTRPRLAPLDNFPISDGQVYDWISPTAADLQAWEEAYRRSDHRAVLAAEGPGAVESPTLREFRAAWDRAPRERRIFISYTSANEPQAEIIKAQLRAKGFHVFIYRENKSNVTSLSDVFHFFEDAGNRFVIDSFDARASKGVQIEARFHELLRQHEGRGRAIEFPKDHETQYAKRARKIDRFLESELAALQNREIALEEKIARNPQGAAELLAERREQQARIEALLKLRRAIALPTRKPKDPPPDAAGAMPRPSGPRPLLPPPDWTNRPDMRTPPPPPSSPNIGGYKERMAKAPLMRPSFKASLGRTPLLHFGGVILGNETAFGPQVVQAIFDPKRPALVIDVDGHDKSCEFDAMTTTELWAAYHFLRPSEDQKQHGAHIGATGVCGIDANRGDHWDFVLHPAVANTLLGRDAMRLDMVLALHDKTLPPVPSGWSTYRWFDESAVILAESGKIYVKASTQPHSVLMRVNLWNGTTQMPVDTRYAVADLYYRFDALRRIDRFAKLLAVLKWLDANGKLPALPAEVVPSRIPLPAKWYHKDVLFDYAATDRAPAAGWDELTAQSLTRSHLTPMQVGVTYTVEASSLLFAPAVRIEDGMGKVVAQGRLDPQRRASRVSFTPSQEGNYRVIATSDPSGRTGVYSLTIQSAKQERTASDTLKSTDPLLRVAEPLVINGKQLKPAIESYHQVHQVELAPGNTYSVEMHAGFDTFLRVEECGQVISENDDIDPDTDRNSRVVLEPTRTEKYRLLATSFEPRATGDYTLTVRQHETIFPRRTFGIESDLQPDSDAKDDKKKDGGGILMSITSTHIIIGAVVVGLIFLTILVLIVRGRSDN